METAATFFTVLAALSTAVQTLVDHTIKKRIAWLDTATPDNAVNESRRQGVIHLASFGTGGILAWSVGLTPLEYVGLDQSLLVNALASGLLVSYGGSFFNEALGAVREFKKTQEYVRGAGRRPPR